MKKHKLNFKWSKSNYRSPTISSIVTLAALTIIGSAFKPSEASAQIYSATEARQAVSEKCETIGQEITDRTRAYNDAFISEDLDKLYYDFWTPEHYEFVPNFAKDRDEMRQQMTLFYNSGGKLYSYDLESLERYVYKNVVYDIGTYDNVGAAANGGQFVINGYYFMRWTKGDDGVWRVDTSAGGPRGNTTKVTPTIGAGPVICHNKYQPDNHPGEEATSQTISDRFDAYRDALVSADANAASEFWTSNVHLYGQGLDLNREGLLEYYRQFFETGRIVTSDIKLHKRFLHGNVAFDIGQSESTVVVNGVQSVKKTNFVIRWEKGHDGVWRIDRIMDLFRV